MLCSLCDSLSLELMSKGYHHAPSYSILEQSARTCELCLLMKTILATVEIIPSHCFPGGVFAEALSEVGRQEGLWLLWHEDVNRGVRVALRKGREGFLEDRYCQLHMFVKPGRQFLSVFDSHVGIH